MSGFRSLRPIHRAGRLFSSMRPGAPSSADLAWARARLNEPQDRLFSRLSHPDQRHLIAVARAVEQRLPADTPDRDVVVTAALLHDVGKSVSGLGTYGRVIATLCGAFASDVAEIWQESSGFTRRVGLYLRYPVLGTDLLTMAESHPWVVAWSQEHHLPPDQWTVPVEPFRIAQEADR